MPKIDSDEGGATRTSLPIVNSLELYSQHVSRWSSCTRCTLHHGRDQVVMARGTVPAPILFVGEGPGQSEDTLGVPFVGNSGKLLDHIIKMALDPVNDFRRSEGKKPLTYCITNVVCCMPTDEDGRKSGAPDAQEVKSCRPRLEELVGIVRPKMVVGIGEVAHKNINWLYEGRVNCHIMHPSYILSRLPFVQRDYAVNRAAVQINTLARKLE